MSRYMPLPEPYTWWLEAEQCEPVRGWGDRSNVANGITIKKANVNPKAQMVQFANSDLDQKVLLSCLVLISAGRILLPDEPKGAKD